MEKALLDRIKSQYQLDLNYLHGISHWERVNKIGLYLSKETKADTTVLSLFAYLHDSKRIDEESDSEHGERSALFAQQLYEEGLLDITADQLDSLVTACEIHSNSRAKVNDATVATCLDADRLDLWRLGITPEPELLFSDAAKRKKSLEYSYNLHARRFL